MIENKAPGKDISAEDLIQKFPLAARSSLNESSVVEVNGEQFGGVGIPLLCGPNMAESEDLMVEVAHFLKSKKVGFMRAGAFKPLSFPYRSDTYTETREEGLQFLKSAKEETGIGIITEAMEERYLDKICEVTDIIQIGARNMQNYPFLVECARTGFPIMLKRHFGASIRDLLGAAEYILNEGNNRVILCERGIVAPHTHRSSSRFLLDLQAVPALKEVTHLPIAVDPSHASFWRPWVPALANASVACGCDAVMLEVHPTPEKAAVDPLQAIDYRTFEDLQKSMSGIAQVIGREVRK